MHRFLSTYLCSLCPKLPHTFLFGFPKKTKDRCPKATSFRHIKYKWFIYKLSAGNTTTSYHIFYWIYERNDKSMDFLSFLASLFMKGWRRGQQGKPPETPAQHNDLSPLPGVSSGDHENRLFCDRSEPINYIKSFSPSFPIRSMSKQPHAYSAAIFHIRQQNPLASRIARKIPRRRACMPAAGGFFLTKLVSCFLNTARPSHSSACVSPLRPGSSGIPGCCSFYSELSSFLAADHHPICQRIQPVLFAQIRRQPHSFSVDQPEITRMLSAPNPNRISKHKKESHRHGAAVLPNTTAPNR